MEEMFEKRVRPSPGPRRWDSAVYLGGVSTPVESTSSLVVNNLANCRAALEPVRRLARQLGIQLPRHRRLLRRARRPTPSLHRCCDGGRRQRPASARRGGRARAQQAPDAPTDVDADAAATPAPSTRPTPQPRQRCRRRGPRMPTPSPRRADPEALAATDASAWNSTAAPVRADASTQPAADATAAAAPIAAANPHAWRPTPRPVFSPTEAHCSTNRQPAETDAGASSRLCADAPAPTPSSPRPSPVPTPPSAPTPKPTPKPTPARRRAARRPPCRPLDPRRPGRRRRGLRRAHHRRPPSGRAARRRGRSSARRGADAAA